MSDIYLLSVPNRNIDYPALALPTLTARLKGDGFSVVQKDINILIKDRMITALNLRAMKSHVLPALIAKSIMNEPLQKYFIKLNSYLRTVDKKWGFDTVEKIKTMMQNRQYESILEDKEGFEAALAIFKINRLLHNFIEYYTYHDKEIFQLFNSAGVDDPINSIIEYTINDIVAENPYMLGFTVLEIQRNFVLYLIRRIKKKYSGKIVVGGADPTRHREAYLQYFDCIDYVLLKEGEDNLSQLLYQIKQRTFCFDGIDGFIYRYNDEIICHEPKPIDICRITHPDFDGISLNKYLTSTLPVHASRACYWALENFPQDPKLAEKRGCKFCAHYKTYSTYYERTAKEVVDDMEMLYHKYGTKLFHLTDDALKPKLGVAISKEIKKRGLDDFRWLVYARLEEGFTASVLQEWYNGGARVIEWGLETASQKVLDAMNKSINVKTAQRIVCEASDIGILNKLFMFHNFPGESLDDLKETLDFLYYNTLNENIRPFPTVRNKMYLLKNTSLYNSLGKEKLFDKVWKPSGDFTVTANYVDLNDYNEKIPLIEKHLEKIKKLARNRFVFSTDDENVMFDLVVSSLKERGYCPYYGSK